MSRRLSEDNRQLYGSDYRNKPISIRLEAELLAHLRQVGRYESYKRNTDVTYADLIREALLQVYPLPDFHADRKPDADTGKNDGA